MWARFFLVAIVVVAATEQLPGQVVRAGPETPATTTWRPADAGQATPAVATSPATTAAGPATTAPPPATTGTPATEPPRRSSTRVSAGNGTLPNEQGQVWREYDISPYTSRVTTTKRPEQAIVDWILRETGYEVWHSEPLGILSVTPRTLRVYHTPQMQTVVADLVERFVGSEGETRTFSLRIVTIDNPNWRARAQQLLHSVPVQTPGVCAWLLPKEEAAVLLADLQRRTDYREHSSPHLLVNNGQSTVVSAMRGRTYVRDVRSRPDVWPGYEAQPAQIDEGFSMEFNPLLSSDRRTIDASIKCEIDQVEKMVPVILEVATTAGPATTRKNRNPPGYPFSFSRTIPLADRSGVGGGHGHGGSTGGRSTVSPRWPACRCRCPVRRPVRTCWC